MKATNTLTLKSLKTISEMNVEAEKVSIAQMILGIKNKSLLAEIRQLLEEKSIVGYTTDGKPLTRKQYNQRLAKGEKQIKDGKYLSQEDIEKDAEQW